MIALSAPTYDLDGTLMMDGRASETGEMSRRVSRSATLDGMAEVTDLGFSHADRTFRVVRRRPTPDEVSRGAYLIETYQQVRISSDEGVFMGALSSLETRRGEMVITVLIAEKLTP